jgi:predicted DsbA family dithiol-disulfide isomerase
MAREVGLSSPEVGEPSRIAEETIRAREVGISAVPTFLVDRWPMGGIQDEQSMTAFFERYVRKRRRERAGE